MPPKPTGFITLPGKFFAKFFEFFELFDFSIFSIFSTFRAEISWNVNFSTFRLFEGKHRDFHGVTDTSQKGTQPPPTPRHQQPSATFTLRAPLLPSSHLKEPHPKRPAQATLFLPSNLLAPSHTSPWNSNPYDLFYPSIPSVFPLFFHGFTRFLHHFTLHSSLPKCTSEDGPGGNRTPPSPNCHLVHQPQNRPRRPPYSVGEVPQNGPFWSDRPPDPLFSLRSQRATWAKLDSWLS